MAARRNDSSLGERIAKAYKSGMSGPTIAMRHKVTVATVYYYLKQLKVKRRSRSLPKAKRSAKKAA